MILPQRRWIFLFGILFILILFSNLIFPVTYDDDFFYAAVGNPFVLQWQQYVGNWHGRIISHTLLRIILQWGFPWTDITSSLLALLFFVASFMQLNLRFWESSKDFPRFFIFAILLYAFIPVSCTAFGMTTFFMSNIFAITLILFFLAPYSAILRQTSSNSLEKSPRFLALFAFLAGASHEQASAILPLLLILAIIIKYTSHKKLPPWFMPGLLWFLAGVAVILLAPSTFREGRIIGYGGAQTWNFMGQTLNWQALGWKRYLYGLANWMLFTKNGAAWIPNAWPYLGFFGVLAYIGRQNKEAFRQAVFYFIGAWGLILIMVFSPLYYQANLIFGMTFLMTACAILMENLSPKFLKRLSLVLTVVFVCIYTVQSLAWNYYRKEYRSVKELIYASKASGAEEVIVPPFTQFAIPTPLGNIYPVFLQRTPTFYKRMAEYYQSPPIMTKE